MVGHYLQFTIGHCPSFVLQKWDLPVIVHILRLCRKICQQRLAKGLLHWTHLGFCPSWLAVIVFGIISFNTPSPHLILPSTFYLDIPFFPIQFPHFLNIHHCLHPRCSLLNYLILMILPFLHPLDNAVLCQNFHAPIHVNFSCLSFLWFLLFLSLQLSLNAFKIHWLQDCLCLHPHHHLLLQCDDFVFGTQCFL